MNASKLNELASAMDKIEKATSHMENLLNEVGNDLFEAVSSGADGNAYFTAGDLQLIMFKLDEIKIISGNDPRAVAVFDLCAEDVRSMFLLAA